MQALAGYMAGVVTVGAAINKIDAYTNLQNRLKLVTNSQQELNKAMNDTFGIAQTTRQEWETVTQVYQRFSDNAKTLGITMEQTAKLTETVSKAVAVSGATAESANAALVQFGQALASGTLRGEELNSVMEQTPALAKAIAQGMGITIGQLRSVAAEGKITSAEIVKALEASAASVDDLFQRTDATISQSLTLLSNELTKFIGEAWQSSGAANLLAGSIKLLSENLSLLADAAVVGGIGYITKAILTKTVAVQADIAASIAQKAADAATLQASIAVADAKIAEAQAHLKNVQATNADAQAKYGATAANLRYKKSVDAVKSAIDEKNALLATVPKRAGLASQALNLVGGPIGAITLGVGALAAGYMYLQSRTAEANAKLEEQGKVADKTRQELLALRGVQLEAAKDNLTASFEAQNEALRKADIAFNGFIRTIALANKQSAEAQEIYEGVRKGIVSQEEALERLNKLDLFTPEQRSQGIALSNTYEENRKKAQNSADAQKVLKIDVDLAGNAMQNAAGKARDKASAMGDDASATRDAAQANREYTQSLSSRLWNQQFINQLTTKHNKTQEEAQLLLEAYRANQKEGIRGVTAEQKELISELTREKKVADDLARSATAGNKARKKAESEADKARKKQERDNERLIEQQARLRDSIQDTFDTEFEQIQRREAYALKDLEAAGFKPDEFKKYSEIIKKEYQAQRDEYLKNLSIELNEYTWTEDYKLEYAYKTDKAILENSNRTNGILKERQLKYLDERYAYEKAQLELNKETRIFQAEQAMYSEIDLIQKRYELEQRKIIETAGIADDERNRLLAALEADTKQQRADKTISIMTNYQSAIGIDTSADTAFIERQKAIDAAYENGLIKQKEYEEQSKLSAMQYQADLATIRLGGMEQIAGGLGEILKGMAGEQSAAYKIMFAIEKGFAIAQAGLAIQTGVSKAIALGFPQNIPVIAQTVMEGAKIMNAIKSIQGNGFYTGGYTGNVGRNQVAGVVHGQEYVLNAEATKRVGRGTLDALNNGGTIGGNVKVEPRITINVPQGYTARQSVNDNGDVTVDIVEKFVVGELSNPSSKISKSMKQNFNITDRR